MWWQWWHKQSLEEFYSDSAGQILKNSVDYQMAVAAYRQLRDLPADWVPDYGSQQWNWFKIGWDAHWIAQRAAT